MQKDWTIRMREPRKPGLALSLEERVKRYRAGRRTPAQRRRLRHALHREFGMAMRLPGAEKEARLENLGRLTAGYTLTYER
jgi:hypothetical protein